MTNSTSSQHLPNRSEFIRFWKDATTFRARRFVPLGVYLVGLLLAAILSRLTHTAAPVDIVLLVGAIAFSVLYPIFYSLVIWRRYDRFIRCPQCRDWIGIDATDKGRMWRIDRDPKWVMISQTGRCTKCGAPILILDEVAENTSALVSRHPLKD